jgi:DNA-binding CsgD family transcriptional regulator/HD-like signal output (HDOD) protein
MTDTDPSLADVEQALRTDPGFFLGALRIANRTAARGHRVGTVEEVAEEIGLGTLRAVTQTQPAFDVFSLESPWQAVVLQYRAQALNIWVIAERLAHEMRWENTDRITGCALLFNVGELVLHHMRAHVGGRDGAARAGLLADVERLDEYVAGAALQVAHRWKLPAYLTRTIAEKDRDVPDTLSAVIELADLLTDHHNGHALDVQRALDLADQLGLEPRTLAEVLYALPLPVRAERALEPPPLTDRELDVIRLLAEGKVYKQIAAELGLAPSTIRSHVHRIYSRIGAADRTQAVVIALQRQWI